MPSPLRFFNDDVSYIIKDKKNIRSWLLKSSQSEKHHIKDLNIVLCSDNQLLKINKSHLNHDYYTDIITFDYSEGKDLIGEIYISIDRIKENAAEQKSRIPDELHRVLIHGVLHLCGYSDKSEKDKITMRKKEDLYLSKRSF